MRGRSGQQAAATIAAAVIVMVAARSDAAKPNIMESCKACHTAADGIVRGKLVSVAPEFKTVSVTVGPLVWLVKYGDDLKVKEGDKLSGAETLKSVPREREIAISFTGTEASPVATQIAVKQPYKVPAEKLLTVDQTQELLRQTPAEGKYLLVDSRPGPMFAEGRIPGAVSLPYTAFKEQAPSILPADKSTLLIFYCAGET